MGNEAVRSRSWLTFVPDQYKTQVMSNEVVHAIPKAFLWIPEHFKIEDTCKNEKDPSMLQYVPDHFKVGSVLKMRKKKRKIFLDI